MSKLNDRADRFAAKLRPPTAVDNRSEDQKWAEFGKKWAPNPYLKEARSRTAEARRNLNA